MKKKNGFIAISILYSFFLCFIALMMGLLASYANSALIFHKINEPLSFKPSYALLADKIMENKTNLTDNCDINFRLGEPPVDGSKSTCGSGLFSTLDNDGTSYYFRGEVNNNYVDFAGIIWRILRINGDGSIRLITDENLVDSNGSVIESAFNRDSNDTITGYTDNKGYTRNNKYDGEGYVINGEDSTVKSKLESWYEENIEKKGYEKTIVPSTFCDDTTTAFKTAYSWKTDGKIFEVKIDFGKIKITKESSSLICQTTDKDFGGKYHLKIGMITLQELISAGYGWDEEKYIGETTNNFIKGLPEENSKQNWFWTMSSSAWRSQKEEDFDDQYINIIETTNGLTGNYVYIVKDNEISEYNAEIYQKLRPVINLNENVFVLKGDGTKDNPYVIDTN